MSGVCGCECVNGRVFMWVSVRFAARITRPMDVAMVFVVSVRMGVRHRLMRVCMLMMLT